MEKKSIDIFEKIVVAGEKIMEAQEKIVKESSESKQRTPEVGIQ
jgi:hypothetical protein